jgi:TetR/AcrR family transcriptional regulator, mexJK operon transcriptional repressor
VRVKTSKKRKSFITAAEELFLNQDYASVTIDAIVKTSKSSKPTFYNYFKSKDDLFEAYIIDSAQDFMNELNEIITFTTTIDKTLYQLGLTYINKLLSPHIIALNKLVIGESKRQPEIVKIYFEQGVMKVVSTFIYVMEKAVKTRVLQDESPSVLAKYFKALCEAEFQELALWGQKLTWTEEEIHKQTETAVKHFLKIYGV